MATALSAAQRRAITGSDPATGRLSARADVCAALAARGLAVPHGRSGHHSYYLSPEGLRLRADLTAARPEVPAPDRPAPAADTFTADDGTGTGTGPGTAPGGGARRAAEVATAWEGLRQIRALLMDGATDAPAPWERERPVHAVALALEAGGFPPARPGSEGYTVAAAAPDGLPEIGWRGAPDGGAEAGALARCAELLDSHGWQCTRHRTRAGRSFLLASPRRTR